VAVHVGTAGKVVVAAETSVVVSKASDAQETSVVFIMNECIGEFKGVKTKEGAKGNKFVQ
jgi:hypothetical protein